MSALLACFPGQSAGAGKLWTFDEDTRLEDIRLEDTRLEDEKSTD